MTICDTFHCVRSGWHASEQKNILRNKNDLALSFSIFHPKIIFGFLGRQQMRREIKIKKFREKLFQTFNRERREEKKSRATNARREIDVYMWNVVSSRTGWLNDEGGGGGKDEKWKKKYLFTTSHTHSLTQEKKRVWNHMLLATR